MRTRFEEAAIRVLQDLQVVDPTQRVKLVADTLRAAHARGEEEASPPRPHARLRAGATVHILKTERRYFEAIVSGAKTFEIRRNDRGFAVGDGLHLSEVDPQLAHVHELYYTGRTLDVEVTYLADDPRFVLPGFVVLGIRRLEDS